MEITFRNAYLCTRFERETLRRGSEKVLKKVPDFLEFRKFELPLHPLRWRPLEVGNEKATGSEKFSKNLPKRFGGFKKGSYLCTTFRYEKTADGTEGKDESPAPEQKQKLFFIEIYRAAFFEVFEQLKFSHSLRRVISNNTFEIRAKDLKQNILYNGEFDPGSG